MWFTDSPSPFFPYKSYDIDLQMKWETNRYYYKRSKLAYWGSQLWKLYGKEMLEAVQVHGRPSCWQTSRCKEAPKTMPLELANSAGDVRDWQIQANSDVEI